MNDYKTAVNSLQNPGAYKEILSSMEATIKAAKAGAFNPASKAAVLTTGVGTVGQVEFFNNDIERVYKEVDNVHVLAN